MNDNYSFYNNAPANFGLCFKVECVSAGECLRGLAARDVGKERSCLTIINPLLADSAGRKSCRFFQKAETVRMAYGFQKAMAKVPHGKVGSVRSSILQWVCKRNYYYLLKGEKPISPDMQKKIAAVLARNGLTAPVEFDRYEWHYEW